MWRQVLKNERAKQQTLKEPFKPPLEVVVGDWKISEDNTNERLYYKR